VVAPNGEDIVLTEEFAAAIDTPRSVDDVADTEHVTHADAPEFG
jgi:hypothetical protein